MSQKLSASFAKRVERGDKYPLLWAMHETFKWEFWIGGICRLFADIFQVMAPFTLRYLIQFATDAYIAQHLPGHEHAPSIGRGLGLVFGITGMQLFQSLGTNHFIYRGMMVGGEARAVLISVIFEKAMRISGRAKAGGKAIESPVKSKEDSDEKMKSGQHKNQQSTADRGKGISGDGMGWGNGRIVNLMSTDTYRIDQASGMFHLIWTGPVAICLTLVLLLINLTYSALAGFGLLIFGFPLLTKAVKSLFARRKAINKITDQRVSLTQEILQAVRFVKLFGWEESFLARLGTIRKREIKAIQILLAIRSAVNSVSMSLPIFASMLSFITYSLSKHVLDPAPIFSSLALFNSLRLPLNLLPMVIGQVVDGWSSVGRIQDFLVAEDAHESARWDLENKEAVIMQNADFTWERIATQDPDGPKGGQFQTKQQMKVAKKAKKEAKKSSRPSSADGKGADSASTLTAQEPFKLHDMDFTVGRKELLAVVGNVGSGKSSLLAALAGDMRMTDGEVVIGASRAFCPQYAWIQNATVKQNILFGKAYEPQWYQQVIEACALQPDLDMLPNEDDTEIGERGITVSGGQKQRLNIARAIYFNADIVLMDDPLSAVDAHVGRHIFDHAISGLLKDKCRILATHQLHVLQRCDRILWLDEGRIVAQGTFKELMDTNVDFAKMMNTTAQEEEEEEEKAMAKEDEILAEKEVKKLKKPHTALMQAEERAVKSVPWSVYGAYVKASGTILNAPGVLLLLILGQGANITTSLWLSFWTSNKFHYNTGTYVCQSPASSFFFLAC